VRPSKRPGERGGRDEGKVLLQSTVPKGIEGGKESIGKSRRHCYLMEGEKRGGGSGRRQKTRKKGNCSFWNGQLRSFKDMARKTGHGAELNKKEASEVEFPMTERGTQCKPGKKDAERED